MDEHPAFPESAEDYGYDLAHETPPGSGAGVAAHADRRSYVETETDDQGGDYGYDLAHDVPRR
jgi:hypothetical protein